MKQNEKIMIIALASLGVLWGASRLLGSFSGAAPKRFTVDTGSELNAEIVLVDKKMLDSRYYVNPFNVDTQDAVAAVSGAFILKGLIYDAQAKEGVAVINNEVLSPGDNLGAARVEEIRKDRVFLRQGESKLELKLEEEEGL